MEKFIREIYTWERNTSCDLDNKVLGAIELRPSRKFYDYEAKYNPEARTEHIIPVNIPEKEDEVTKIALKAHKILNCRGYTFRFRYYKTLFIY